MTEETTEYEAGTAMAEAFANAAPQKPRNRKTVERPITKNSAGNRMRRRAASSPSRSSGMEIPPI